MIYLCVPRESVAIMLSLNRKTPMDASQPQLMSVAQALEILPVSREFLYRQIKIGRVPSYRLGRKVMLDLSEVLSVMRQSQGESGNANDCQIQ